MASLNGKSNDPPGLEPMSITVGGFKSIAREQTVEIRPLTILAGANSSGKSSLMQAVLLLKQTLEASFDPGALLVNGPNVRFTQINQMLTKCGNGSNSITIGLHVDDAASFKLRFRRGGDKRLEVYRASYSTRKSRVVHSEMSKEDIIKYINKNSEEPLEIKSGGEPYSVDREHVRNGGVSRSRCWLLPFLTFSYTNKKTQRRVVRKGVTSDDEIVETCSRILQRIIHLPGLRGNPARQYPLTSTGPEYPATFENYTASIIREWSDTKDERISILGDNLRQLGLTWKVTSESVDDAQVELRVGRLPMPKQGGAKDLVNIADVGFGVSQTLPVAVALLAAEDEQILYIEQPEIHLHPRAQVAMGKLLADAANRGVRVIIETHSSLLLLGVQSQIADGHLDPKRVKLHWFNRSETDGSTDIVSADVDDEGRFPGWPEDFDDVSLEAQQHYMDAVEKRQVAG